MKHTLPLACCLAASAAFLSGCGDNTGSENRQAMAQYEEAIALVQGAAEGPAADPNDPASTAQRRQQLTAAVKKLEDLVKNPAFTQQDDARRTLASAYSALALTLTRQASDRWAAMAGAQNNLLNTAIAASAAQQSADALSIDAKPRLGLELQKKTLADDAVKLQADQATAQQAVTALDQEIAKHEAAKTAAVAEEQKLNTQSMAVAGQEQYDLALSAIKQRGLAQAAAAESEKLQAQRAVQATILSNIKSRVALNAQAAASVDDRIAKLKQDEEAATRSRQQALGVGSPTAPGKAGILQSLAKDYSQFSADWNQSVGAPMDEATRLAAASVEQVQKTKSAGRGHQLDLLAAYCDQAAVVSQYVSLISSRMRGVQTVVAKLDADAQTELKALAEKQAGFVETANKTIDSGKAVSSQIAGVESSGPAADARNAQQANLDAAQRLVQQSDLNPNATPPPPLPPAIPPPAATPPAAPPTTAPPATVPATQPH